MSTKLSAKAAGSIVYMNLSGTKTAFIVINQGKPSSSYDSSCDGTWLVQQDCVTKMAFDSSSQLYSSSAVKTWLEGTYKGYFDSDIQAVIKSPKLPWNGSTVSCSGPFLLSMTEVGLTSNSYWVTEGATCSYFTSNSLRIAKYNGSASFWWSRSRDAGDSYYVCGINTDGSNGNYYCSNSFAVRPALILPSSLSVGDDGYIVTNTAPTIASSSGSSGVSLGTKSAVFSFNYTVADADGDALTVTEKIDSNTIRTVTSVASGTSMTFSGTTTESDFMKILNGSHTLYIVASDGTDQTTYTATFTKSVTNASITLKAPLTVSGDITAAVLNITGSIPDDATYTVLATNNANDTTPVWQDVTSDVKNGVNFIFNNTTCANGAAFNFKITVSEGSSGTGGYISAVNGAFQ